MYMIGVQEYKSIGVVAEEQEKILDIIHQTYGAR